MDGKKQQIKPYTFQWVLQDKTFQNTVKKLRRNTINNYGNAMLRYCKMLQKTPTEIIDEALDEQDRNVTSRKRKYKQYLSNYYDYTKDLAPTTQQSYIVRVVNFYKKNEVDVSIQKDTTTVETLQSNFYIPKREEVKRCALQENLRNRCIILLQSSSGMGVSEVCSITKQEFFDGQHESGVTTFHPVRAKTNKRYTTFCTPECTRHIHQWLKECETKGLDYDSLFGLTPRGIMTMYQRLSIELGMPHQEGTYHRIRSHNFRKVFNQLMRADDCNADIVDYLSGRQERGSRAKYHEYDVDYLRKHYMNHMKAVTFIDEVIYYTDAEIVEKLKEFDSMKKELEEIRKTLGFTTKVKKSNLPDDRKQFYTQFFVEKDKKKQGLPYDSDKYYFGE